MSKVSLKKLYLPHDMPADEKIRLCAAHINDLETNLELLMETVNRKIEEVGKNVS